METEFPLKEREVVSPAFRSECINILDKSIFLQGEEMEAGKLDELSLRHNVFPFVGALRKEVILRAALGEDSAALDVGSEYQLVLSSDPITAASTSAGSLAIYVSCNDIASNGAEPMAVMLTLLLPEGKTDEDVKQIMYDADLAAKDLGIEIIGGHTEFTFGLNQTIIAATAIGKVKRGKLLSKKGAKAKQQIILTKGAGIEGTSILLSDHEHFWKQHLTKKEILKGLEMSQKISIVKEAKIATELGATAMHDVTEGGVLGGVYELAIGAELGITIYKEKIKVDAVTFKMCKLLNVDFLRLISSGSLLIVAEDGESICSALKKEGIEASVIGFTTKERVKKLIDKDGNENEIAAPQSDEIWQAVKKIKKLL